MRVLVVEDDPELGRTLQRGLIAQGFITDVVCDGEEAVAAAITGGFDVISLDVMVPALNGFDVCRELRRHRIATPVLMLSARDALEDRVRGLESGADDYLAKPFEFAELVARLRALTRRHLEQRQAVIELGDLRLDTSARTVFVRNRRLLLTAKEFAVLEYLMHNPGRLLSRDQIADHVWSYALRGESNLVDVYMARLRRKLEAEGVDQAIETARMVGYRFRRNPRCRGSSATPASA